jgi:hypothetical protein
VSRFSGPQSLGFLCFGDESSESIECECPSQVKEKFGGLRFYVNRRNDAIIRRRIGIAVDECFRTCEVCGQPGTLREDRLIKTLCDEHDASGQGETVMAELSKRATSGTHERS